MNVPNLITISRLVITVMVFVCLEMSVAQHGGWSKAAPESAPFWDMRVGEPWLVWTAFVLFLVAAGTDFLDGYLARKWNLVTAFGRVADPFADKVLVVGSLVTLMQFGAAMRLLTTWYVVIVIAREFLVTAIRGVVEASGKPFPADKLGKWKMVSQCILVGTLMTYVAGSHFWDWLGQPIFWISLLLTIVSGLNYVWKARDVLFRGAS